MQHTHTRNAVSMCNTTKASGGSSANIYSSLHSPFHISIPSHLLTNKYIMADRKARLAALAAKAGRGSKVTNEDEAQEVAEESVTVSFRNYAPNDESLEQTKDEEPAPKRVKTEEKTALQIAVEQAQKEAALAVGEGGDVATMGPKKMNADLKRDIQDKMDKLERRTQRAIVSLLKERLEQEAAQDVPDLD